MQAGRGHEAGSLPPRGSENQAVMGRAGERLALPQGGSKGFPTTSRMTEVGRDKAEVATALGRSQLVLGLGRRQRLEAGPVPQWVMEQARAGTLAHLP